MATGQEFELTIAALHRLLPLCLDESASFREAFPETLQAKGCGPSKPWRLVIYFEEATPRESAPTGQREKVHRLLRKFLGAGALPPTVRLLVLHWGLES